jgi:formate dehydrogenase maturation protein FdhE
MRLGDYVDDYCSRCKRSMDHAVVSLAGDEAQKVRCRTCSYEHSYRHNKSGKKEMTAKDAFNQLLAAAMGQTSAAEPEKKPRRKRGS